MIANQGVLFLELRGFVSIERGKTILRHVNVKGYLNIALKKKTTLGNGYVMGAIMSVNTIVGFCDEILMVANYMYY